MNFQPHLTHSDLLKIDLFTINNHHPVFTMNDQSCTASPAVPEIPKDARVKLLEITPFDSAAYGPSLKGRFTISGVGIFDFNWYGIKSDEQRVTIYPLLKGEKVCELRSCRKVTNLTEMNLFQRFVAISFRLACNSYVKDRAPVSYYVIGNQVFTYGLN